MNHNNKAVREDLKKEFKVGEVTITKDNITDYYEFMDENQTKKYALILDEILEDRLTEISLKTGIAIEQLGFVKKLETKDKTPSDGTIKLHDLTYETTVFGVKDTLNTVDQYVADIRASEPYKTHINDSVDLNDLRTKVCDISEKSNEEAEHIAGMTVCELQSILIQNRVKGLIDKYDWGNYAHEDHRFSTTGFNEDEADLAENLGPSKISLNDFYGEFCTFTISDYVMYKVENVKVFCNASLNDWISAVDKDLNPEQSKECDSKQNLLFNQELFTARLKPEIEKLESSLAMFCTQDQKYNFYSQFEQCTNAYSVSMQLKDHDELMDEDISGFSYKIWLEDVHGNEIDIEDLTAIGFNNNEYQLNIQCEIGMTVNESILRYTADEAIEYFNEEFKDWRMSLFKNSREIELAIVNDSSCHFVDIENKNVAHLEQHTMDGSMSLKIYPLEAGALDYKSMSIQSDYKGIKNELNCKHDEFSSMQELIKQAHDKSKELRAEIKISNFASEVTVNQQFKALQ